jgi:(p)ppGpp synthase/HD superfamily hydrolase
MKQREPFLTRRFDLALHFASGLHYAQVRKGTNIPYIAHLMSVAALVLEAGGDEDRASPRFCTMPWKIRAGRLR